MNRYIDSQDLHVDTTFDTSQFGQFEVVAYLEAVKELPRIDVFGIGIGGSTWSEIAKEGNRLFFGACDKRFYCITTEGKEVWTFSTNHINVSPVVEKQRVYFGSFDTNLYALTVNGKLLWKFETQGKIASTPCITPSGIVFGSQDGNIYCVSQEGNLVWKYQTSGAVTQDPVLYKDRILIGSSNANLYILSLEGKVVKKLSANGSFGTPVIVDDVIYVGNFDKNFYSFTLEGKLLWKVKTPLVVGHRRPLYYNGVIYACARDGIMYALKDGRIINRYVTPQGPLYTTPVTDGKLLYFCGVDGNFYAFDRKTGSLAWKFAAKKFLASSPLLAKGVLYFGGWDGRVYALDTTGKVLWTYRMKMSTPAALTPEEELIRETQGQVIWTPEETGNEEEDRYKQQFLGEGSERKSEYQVKSDYIVKSKYTKKRKVKSMSSGWED